MSEKKRQTIIERLADAYQLVTNDYDLSYTKKLQIQDLLSEVLQELK